VEDGEMRFLTDGEVVMNKVVDESSSQAIPPGLDHRVEFEDPVRFSIDYLCVDGGRSSNPLDEITIIATDEGGESACYAHLVCTVCGAVLESDPHPHRSSPRLD
jgi:hypothetical protein